MTASTNITVISMTPEMVPTVANVHLKAFAGYMNTRIGTPYVRAFINWFLHAERAITLVAIDEGSTVIGYVVGAPLGYERALSRDLFWVAAMGMAVRPWLFFHSQFRSTVINRLKLVLGHSSTLQTKPELPEPTMVLVGIGVSLAARGKKAGFRLIQAFEDRAQQLQMRSLLLSVYPDNAAARRLYAYCGWQPSLEPREKKEAMLYFRVLAEEQDYNEARSRKTIDISKA